MAFLYMSFDLPPEDRIDRYAEVALQIVRDLRTVPGFKAITGLRSPDHQSPEVVVVIEFEDEEQVRGMLYGTFIEGEFKRLRQCGCTNLAARLYRASPIIPRA